MDIHQSIQYDERLRITRVLSDVYLLNDADDGTGYLVIGQDRALVIDTCNGQQDYHAAIRSLTDLPLVLVNTHAHGDHVGGNRYFSEALMAEAELPAYAQSACPAKAIQEGDTIDLGDRLVEVILVPGHTPGGVCLLDEKDRVLFTGDSVLGRTVWLFMENSVSIRTYKASLMHLNEYRTRFDALLTGHGIGLDTPAYIDRLIEACDIILAGQPSERLGEYAVWGMKKPCCYYVGEGDQPATLVYNPWLVHDEPLVSPVRFWEMPACRMIASQPGMWGDGTLEAFDEWMSKQPRGLYPLDFLAFDEQRRLFCWYYLQTPGMDAPDGMTVVDFPGGLYICAAGIDGADPGAVKKTLDEYLAAHPAFAYDDGRPPLGHMITPPAVCAALGFGQMDYLFPIKIAPGK